MNITGKLALCAILAFFSFGINAQTILQEHYHRNSLYSVVLKHADERQLYSKEIVEAFTQIPIPPEYNNHNLKFKVLPAPILQKMSKGELESAYKDKIWHLLNQNKIGGRLVAKWFNRDSRTGAFNMDLVKERGLYDANFTDIALAMNSIRGKAQLADAGEKLISHTYVLVNDIRYVDDELEKNLRGLFGTTLPSMIPIVGVFALGNLSKTIDMQGFKVFVTSYLFRLDWNDELEGEFYNNLWMDNNSLIPERREEFDRWMGKCKLNYLGYTTVFSGEMTYVGVSGEKDMFVKLCTRTIDKAISDLQKSFDDFKVFTPLVSTSPLSAYIGVKDGVKENSEYEVLETVMDENGNIDYERVGIIKPVKDKIWNNLYLSVEEGWEAADFGFTTFEKVSGGDFYPGMLIREI